MHRRQMLSMTGMGAAATLLLRPASAGTTIPPIWQVKRNGAAVYIFPIGDAKDRSWLTPKLKRAFDASREVWFESPHPPPSAKTTVSQAISSQKDADDARHNLFDVVGPRRAKRLLAAAQKYGVKPEALAHKRPWAAYFVLNRGYWAQRSARGLGTMNESPDYILANMAHDAGKPVKSEYATNADVTALFSTMPLEAQCQRLDFLMDYFDDEAAGKHKDPYGWISGRTYNLTIDEMRLRYPALYAIEHIQRNVKWARWIDGFLARGGTYFIGMGLNHTLGPDSIPAKLRARGLDPVLA